MTGNVQLIVIGASWLAIGLILSLVMGRRGHVGFGWLVVGTLLGPLALALAIDSIRHGEALAPIQISTPSAAAGAGTVDVLAGYDGSPESRGAIEGAIRTLGDRLGRLTVAMVVPFDNIQEAERIAGHDLRRIAEAAGVGASVTECTVLHGRPSEALRQWASEGGYDLIAVGARGSGLSKRLIGSAAYELAQGGKVPVLIVGTE